MIQRIHVLTVEGHPFFLVHRNVRDAFIVEEIEARYGKQPDGSKHEWEAEDVKEVSA